MTIEEFLLKKISLPDIIKYLTPYKQIDPLKFVNTDPYLKRYKLDLFDSKEGFYDVKWVNTLDVLTKSYTLIRSELIQNETVIYNSIDNWVLVYIEELWHGVFLTIECKQIENHQILFSINYGIPGNSIRYTHTINI